jgi:tetratricopeptide (TPR) repeat protein
VQEQVQEAVLHLQHAQGQHAEGQHSAAQPHAGNSPSHAGAGSSSIASTAGALKDPAVLDAYLNTLLAAVKSLGPCLPAATVQAAAAALTDLQDNHPKLQYLDLMLNLAHKDMNAALSALHTYFDSSGKSSGAGRGPAPGSKGKGQHQAALHNLASLQAALGHPQEALAALQELLRLGQQQGDEWSLLHGLAILCRVMGVSEGLQDSSRGAGGQMSAAGSSSSSGGSSTSSATGAWAGWGLLDLRRTEQQLQLQALLQRCLDSARDMHVPHIAGSGERGAQLAAITASC